MRARNIKPGLFKNELLGVEDPLLTILFVGLWCLADRDGILEDRPLRIKAEIFPYREGTDINRYLTVLSRLGFIRRYEVNGNPLIMIVNFDKHQHPHHTEKSSGLPKYEEKSNGCDVTVNSPLNNGYAPSDLLIPDSLIPDSLIPDSLIPDSRKKTITAKKSAVVIPKPESVSDSTWNDFLSLRKAKKSPLTETALTIIQREAKKAGMTTEAALSECCARGWQGFKAEWMEREKRNSREQVRGPGGVVY